MEEALKKAVEEAKAVKLEEERARGREVIAAAVSVTSEASW